MEQAHLSHRVPVLLALGKPTRCGGKGHAMGSSAGLLVMGLLLSVEALGAKRRGSCLLCLVCFLVSLEHIYNIYTYII